MLEGVLVWPTLVAQHGPSAPGLRISTRARGCGTWNRLEDCRGTRVNARAIGFTNLEDVHRNLRRSANKMKSVPII